MNRTLRLPSQAALENIGFIAEFFGVNRNIATRLLMSCAFTIGTDPVQNIDLPKAQDFIRLNTCLTC